MKKAIVLFTLFLGFSLVLPGQVQMAKPVRKEEKTEKPQQAERERRAREVERR